MDVGPEIGRREIIPAENVEAIGNQCHGGDVPSGYLSRPRRRPKRGSVVGLRPSLGGAGAEGAAGGGAGVGSGAGTAAAGTRSIRTVPSSSVVRTSFDRGGL